MKTNRIGPTILILFAVSIAIRLLFFFFGAEVFYGTEQFYISGDTYSFVQPVVNLFEHGTLTYDINREGAQYSRLPGYSLLLTPFYLLFGNTKSLYFSIVFFQIILDGISSILIFLIARKRFKNEKIGIITALLYATYPFILVWTPVVYAETFGVFFMLLFVYLTTKRAHPLLLGVIICAGFFVRPQLLFLFPAYLLGEFITNKKQFLRISLLSILGFGLLYIPWPIRNYVNHDVVVPLRDISKMRSWQNDVINFHNYITGLQTGWEPQMTQILNGEKVTWPSKAYAEKGDSMKLEKVLQMSRTCSDGFAMFMKKPIIENACTKETAELWQSLHESQMRNNSLNYYLIVPIKGLIKCIFKFNLVENWKSPDRSSLTQYLSSGMFIYRSLLILLGWLGLILLYRMEKIQQLDITIAAFFIFWYFWLCFVTRFLEIRYLLPTDILLLIPAGFAIGKLKWKNKLT